MKKIPVALQVYSVREDAEKDFKGTMQRVKDMGYDCVELAGLYGMEAKTIRSILDEVGVKAISAHVPFVELNGDTEKVVSDYVEVIGCSYVAVPYLTDDLRPGTPGFQTVLDAIPKIGQVCKDKGAVLLYHNHDFEFAKMDDGSYALDYLYSKVSPDLLQTEIDTCWVNVAGENPAAYIRKYAGRCPVVHLKDFYKEGNPANLYELIGMPKDEQKNSGGRFEFRPVGYGMQIMPEIVEAAIESGAKYVVVEQDVSVGRTPLEAVKMSRDYLRPLGL